MAEVSVRIAYFEATAAEMPKALHALRVACSVLAIEGNGTAPPNPLLVRVLESLGDIHAALPRWIEHSTDGKVPHSRQGIIPYQ